MSDYVLNNNITIPKIGMGTWKINDSDLMYQILDEGIKLGYYLIDTASSYSNEIIIGKFLKENQSLREKLFIQDKVWNTNRGYNETIEACKKSLKKLKIDYLDAYLIHYPFSKKEYKNWEELNSDTWRALEKLYEEGFVRSIGVCNFNIFYLEGLIKNAKYVPMILQNEFHPGLSDLDLLNYCKKNKIHFEASSPLGNGKILNDKNLINLANKYNITVPQLIFAWEYDKKITIIPKTSNVDKLRENIKNFTLINLDKEDIVFLNKMKYCGGLNINPDDVGNAFNIN